MRALITTTPGRGHLGAVAPLARALRREGHQVVWASGASAGSTVTDWGFEFRPAGMDVPERVAALQPRMSQIMAMPPRARRPELFCGYFAEIAAPVMARDLASIVDDVTPDVVIHETAELAAPPLAAARGIPQVTVAFSGAVPESAVARLPGIVGPLWEAAGAAVPPDGGLAGDLYLHPFPPSFGQRPSWPVQPMQLGAPASHGDLEAPSWLDDVGVDRAAVYVTFGTERAALDAPWAEIIAAIGECGVDAVLTVGQHVELDQFGERPAGVHVERFVPQQLLLSRVSAVVSHAGAGSVLGAASHGTPQVLLPAFADQWDNADAVAGTGAGRVLELDERHRAAFAQAITECIDMPSRRDAARAIAVELAAMPTADDLLPTVTALG